MAGAHAVVGQTAARSRIPRVDPVPLSDSQIIAGSADRPDLFEEIYRRHHEVVLRHVERRVGPDAGADIASEVFIRAFSARTRFNHDYPSARPWLFGIATNLIRHHFRKSRRATTAHQRLMVRELGHAPDGTAESARRVDADLAGPDLARCLEELRDVDREILLAYALHDLTYAEIAQKAGIPIGTVRSRLARARARIRQRTEAGVLALPTD